MCPAAARAPARVRVRAPGALVPGALAPGAQARRAPATRASRATRPLTAAGTPSAAQTSTRARGTSLSVKR